MTPLAPVAAFYLLPMRAWELLAGSCLAIAKKHDSPFGERASSLCLASGLILLLLSVVVVRNDGFPGWIALAPAAGSTLMLAGIGASRSAIQRLLARPAMVFVGKRSYALYLWHWPVFSFVDYRFFLSGPSLVLALKIVITIAATLLTYRFIERPMRLWLNDRRRRGAAFGAFVVAATALAGAGYAIRFNYYLDVEPRDIAAGGVSVNPEGRGWVVAIGDSQGAVYGVELASLARRLGFRLNLLSAPGKNELPGDRDTLWPSVSGFLGDRKPDVVILAQAWSTKFGSDGEGRFGETMAALGDRATQIIVLLEPPTAPPDATRRAILAGARPPFFEDPSATQRHERAKTIIDEFENSSIRVLDVADIFLNADHSIRLIAPDGRVTFQDGRHLSASGTALVRPRLEQALRDALHMP